MNIFANRKGVNRRAPSTSGGATAKASTKDTWDPTGGEGSTHRTIPLTDRFRPTFLLDFSTLWL